MIWLLSGCGPVTTVNFTRSRSCSGFRRVEAVRWVSWPWFPASLAHLDTHHTSVWRGCEVPGWDRRHLGMAALTLLFPPRKWKASLVLGVSLAGSGVCSQELGSTPYYEGASSVCHRVSFFTHMQLENLMGMGIFSITFRDRKIYKLMSQILALG